MVHLVCFLAVLKILTARTNRDYTYVKMIAVMELLAAAVLSISLSFFAYLALFLLLAIAAFSSGEVRRSAQTRRGSARRIAGVSASAGRARGVSVQRNSGDDRRDVLRAAAYRARRARPVCAAEISSARILQW